MNSDFIIGETSAEEASQNHSLGQQGGGADTDATKVSWTPAGEGRWRPTQGCEARVLLGNIFCMSGEEAWTRKGETRGRVGRKTEKVVGDEGGG